MVIFNEQEPENMNEGEIKQQSYCFFMIGGRVPSSDEIDRIVLEMNAEAEKRAVPLEKIWLEWIERGEIDNPGEERMKEFRKKVAENENVVAKVSLYVNNEIAARRFLKQCAGMTDVQVIRTFKRYRNEGLTIQEFNYSAFHTLLSSIGLYNKSYPNFMDQVKY